MDTLNTHNLLSNRIDLLIVNATKDHDSVRLRTLRLIKNAFLTWKTAKENVGKELDESTELQILKKMVKTRKESADMYHQAGRQDLVDNELDEVKIIEEFLPQSASEDAIMNAFRKVIDDGLEPTMKNMGIIIKQVKGYLPNAEGALVAKIVKSQLS